MVTNEIIKNRSEIVFLYDIKDANPNGDPLDENKPRIDEETGINIVTDVRLKRTIRDYLKDFKENEIFIKEIRKSDGTIETKEEGIEKLIKEIRKSDGTKETEEAGIEKIKNGVLDKYVDIRLFGGTFALKKEKKVTKKSEKEPLEGIGEASEKDEKEQRRAFSLTGPIQFRFGRSLHKVNGPVFVKGTTVMPSKEAKGQGTFTETYVLPYSLICFYGIINENAAKHTHLTEEDVNLLLECMWNGTKNLISRSKVGQMPRLLLKVNYNENDYHIGDLDKMIKLSSEKNDEQIRDVSEVTLDASELIKTLNKNKDKIASVEFKVDDRAKIDLSGLDKEINKKEIQIK